MYNVLVLGAGYLGSAIAREFKRQKQRVYAVTRKSEKAAAFESEGLLPIIADLNQPETLKKIPAAHFIVIAVAPDISDEAHYRKIYLEGIRNFLESCAKRPRPYLIVLISSTSVWRDREGSEVDETLSPDAETEKGKILIESEKIVLQSGYPAVVFRLSGIYGPGRNRLETFQSGKWPGQSDSDSVMNMIHVEDAALAISVLFKKAKEGEVYIGTDDEPVLRSAFCHWLSTKTQGTPRGGNLSHLGVTGKRLKNQRLKALGFQFKYPSFREGYGSF